MVIFLIIKFKDNIKESKLDKLISMSLSFMLIITEMSYFWRLVGVESLNANPVDHLPITICGWAIIFSSFMVVSKSKSLFDIVYFWVFAGSTFGLLTPTVITFTGPTRFRYYQFWLEHISGFIVIFYMIFVHNFRPNWKSMLKSYICLIVLAIIAIIANNMLPGANYLFVARPEDTASILDILPKNYFVRLTIMASIITILFFLIYLPWFLKDRKAKKALTSSSNIDIENVVDADIAVVDTSTTNKKTSTKSSTATKTAKPKSATATSKTNSASKPTTSKTTKAKTTTSKSKITNTTKKIID